MFIITDSSWRIENFHEKVNFALCPAVWVPWDLDFFCPSPSEHRPDTLTKWILRSRSPSQAGIICAPKSWENSPIIPRFYDHISPFHWSGCFLVLEQSWKAWTFMKNQNIWLCDDVRYLLLKQIGFQPETVFNFWAPRMHFEKIFLETILKQLHFLPHFDSSWWYEISEWWFSVFGKWTIYYLHKGSF